MRILFDSKCESCGHVDEVFGEKSEPVRCTTCGSSSKPIISPVKCQLDGVTGDFPGAAMKWARDHERAARTKG